MNYIIHKVYIVLYYNEFCLMSNEFLIMKIVWLGKCLSYIWYINNLVIQLISLLTSFSKITYVYFLTMLIIICSFMLYEKWTYVFLLWKLKMKLHVWRGLCHALIFWIFIRLQLWIGPLALASRTLQDNNLSITQNIY